MNAARRARKKANHQAAKERRDAKAEDLGDLVKRVYSESEKAAAQTALANLRRIRKNLSGGDNLPE